MIASAKVLSEISRKVSKLDDVTVMDGTITDSNFKMSFSDEVSAAEGFLIEILAEIFFLGRFTILEKLFFTFSRLHFHFRDLIGTPIQRL